MGPAKGKGYGLEFRQSGYSNDYWTISNINMQGRAKFEGLRSSSITGFSTKLIRDGLQEPAILFKRSAYLTISGINIRETDSPYAAVFESDSDYIVMGNFLMEKPVLIKGNVYSIKNGIVKGGIKTPSGRFTRQTDLDYTDDASWKTFRVRNGEAEK